MSYFIINTAVANVYKDASHKSAVVTQALMGESCEILDNRDNWYLIKQWDNYKGWIYHFNGFESVLTYETTLIMQDIFGRVISPDKAKLVSNLVLGNQVTTEENRDGYKIVLPDGRIGFSNNHFGKNRDKASRKEIIKTASKFLGTPYFWGGKTPYGFDCSGLVQTVFKANGIDLPRDSNKQSEFFANKIDEENIQNGDLLFFGENNDITHVAIATGGLNFINARGFVQEESIDKKNPQFNRNLRNLFFHAVSIKNMIDKT